MRVLRLGLVALVVASFAAAAGGTAATRPGRCAVPGTLVAPPLPTTITAGTPCGTFAIARGGRIARLSRRSLPVPAGVGWWPVDGVWARTDRQGHLVVGRWHHMLWRSTNRLSSREADDVVLAGNRLVFSYGSRAFRLYVAPLDGRERLVTRGEFPLGGTAGGFYSRRIRGAELLLRSGAGRLRDTVARDVFAYAYDPRGGDLLFAAHDRLLRARGARVRTIAGLPRLGLPARHLQILPLGRLVGLETEHRLVVLRADGSRFGSTPLPFTTRRIEFVSGQPTASPDGAAVAFAVIRADRPGESQVNERGVETVYLLRPGARSATAVYRRRTWFDVCGHAADLAWHGRWLLYGSTGGSAAAIDTSSGTTIGLSSVVRRLPGFAPGGTGFFDLSWRPGRSR